MSKPFLVFFIIGAIGVMVFAIYKSVYGVNPTYLYEQNYLQLRAGNSIPISDTLASTFFMDYHNSATPESSQGLLKNENAAISQFYLDDEKIIKPLREKALALGKEFIGLSAVLGYNKEDDTHTIMWVAVVDGGNGTEVLPELMLPQATERWDSYIYDYTTVCPSVCPLNSERLWKKNWEE